MYVDATGETLTYQGLVKLKKFASESEIAVNDKKVLEAIIANAPNVTEITEYDGPSLQKLKQDYDLTLSAAKDLINSYKDLTFIDDIRSHKTVLSDEEYESYRKSKKFDANNNIVRESDLIKVSDESRMLLKRFFKYVDDNPTAKSAAINELEKLVTAIDKEQNKILLTTPSEIPDLISSMTAKSNEVKDIVIKILQEHYRCTLTEARKILQLYPSIETIIDNIECEVDDEGNEISTLPSDIWTNKKYRYDGDESERQPLPFPTQQEYQEFIAFLKKIQGDEYFGPESSLNVILGLESLLDLMVSNDLDAAKELQIKMEKASITQIEEAINTKDIPQKIIDDDIDIHLDNNVKSDPKPELEDIGFQDPSSNISRDDLSILERILQRKIDSQRIAMKDKLVWSKYFGLLRYEEVDAETIRKKIETMKKLLY